MNFKALVLVAATFATSAAFAATTELGDLGVDITASTDFTDTANAVTTAVGGVLSAGETTIAENVAIIGQNGAVEPTQVKRFVFGLNFGHMPVALVCRIPDASYMPVAGIVLCADWPCRQLRWVAVM